MWNCPNNPPCGTETVYANSISDVEVTSAQPAGNTAVYTYPDVQALYNDTPLSSFSSMTSSFAESMPQAASGMIGEAACDIWLNNWVNEVMIWVDTQGQDPGSWLPLLATLSVGGQSFNVYRYATEIIVLLNGNETTGSVDILTTLKALESKGIIPSGSTLTAVDFGWEICSTGGTAQTFRLTNFSISPAP
jgi:hypothetical protein